MREHKYRGKLKLTIPEWGHYKLGDTETFWFNLLHQTTGLIRFPIDDHWEVVEWDVAIGLEDIIGMTIYENDRVSFETVSEFSLEPIKSQGHIRWDEEDAGFYIENDDEGYPHVKLWFATNIKIINN